MSQRIRLGNTYSHNEHGLVLTTHKDYDNVVWFREVSGRDNGGVISTSDGVYREDYKEFLGNVSMRDYPDNWSDIAAAIRKRDSYACRACPRSQNASDGPDWQESDAELHVHHIVPLGAGGSNARSNLITLCDKCHGLVHSGVT